jgi:putative heme-binding domain-containing protein
VARVLLANWAAHSPELRGAIVDELLQHPDSITALLDAVAAKKVSPAEIDLPRRQRLLGHFQPYIKTRAAQLLADTAAATANRQKAVDAMWRALELKGDAKRGTEVFRQHCAVCHKLNDLGNDVGPNLATVREWTGEALLASILDPNRQAEPKYVAYTATTTAGESIFGVVASEGAQSVTMKGLDGKERAVPRDELKSLESTNRSLMPDAFESAINQQQMADLIQFLKAPETAK